MALTQTLQLPLPNPLTGILGIHQPDLVIKSALDVAFADLRANPSLLNYVWASLPQDPLTWKEYGQMDLNEAKKWFLSTNIPVKVAPVRDELQSPSVEIILGESAEVTNESTIGDINPEASFEGTNTDWPALTNPFVPVSYDSATGTVVLKSSSVPTDVYVAAGMFIVDKIGGAHEILETYDANSFGIAPGTVADFKGAVLKGHRPAWMTSIESSSFRESYRLSINAGPEKSRVILLHSVVVFCLLRYKQVLLEARGFERSTFSSSDIGINPNGGETEPIFVRYVTLSGNVRQYWPKVVAPVIDAVLATELRVTDTETLPSDTDPDTSLWLGDTDTIDSNRKK